MIARVHAMQRLALQTVHGEEVSHRSTDAETPCVRILDVECAGCIRGNLDLRETPKIKLSLARKLSRASRDCLQGPNS